VFSRRVRDIPETPVVKHTKARFVASGHEFRVHSHYMAAVTFVEGELPYVAQIGDRVHLIDAIAPPFTYTIERTEDEEEYVLGEYQPADEVLAAFGVTDWEYQPYGVHPAQPYVPSALAGGLWVAGLIFAPIAIALLAYSMIFGGGKVVLDRDMRPARAVGSEWRSERTFEVSSPGDLLKLNLQMPAHEPWRRFDATIFRGKEPVFKLHDKLASTKYATTAYWSVPNLRIETYFTLPEAGTYTLRTTVLKGKKKTLTRQRKKPQALRITIREGIKLSRYYAWLLGLSAVAFVCGPLASARFEAKRWDDEEDHDDDD
ncbi:MAG: DUF4178 domain-containing protein, partial [Chromatiales bacterium]|nr:DUF4178 domain-containing protein [Chromatiales bacterium]